MLEILGVGTDQVVFRRFRQLSANREGCSVQPEMLGITKTTQGFLEASTGLRMVILDGPCGAGNQAQIEHMPSKRLDCCIISWPYILSTFPYIHISILLLMPKTWHCIVDRYVCVF